MRISDWSSDVCSSDLGVADLHESMGALAGRQSLMEPFMRGLNPGLRIAGPAVTAYCAPGDNLMVQKALLLARAGQVVVLSNGGTHHGALLGEMMGTYMLQKKLAGAVVYGPIRDIDALREQIGREAGREKVGQSVEI